MNKNIENGSNVELNSNFTHLNVNTNLITNTNTNTNIISNNNHQLNIRNSNINQ